MICNSCKADKELDEMVKDKSCVSGRRALCKTCKCTKDKEFRVARKESKAVPVKIKHKLNPTQMKSCGLGGWTGPRVRDEHEAPGVLVDYMSSVYTPAQSYYRNDGLSHIKTRGTLC